MPNKCIIVALLSCSFPTKSLIYAAAEPAAANRYWHNPVIVSEELGNHHEIISSVAVSSNTETTGFQDTASLFDIAKKSLINAYRRWVGSGALPPEDRSAAALSKGATIFVPPLIHRESAYRQDESTKTSSENIKEVSSVAFSPDGRTLASGSDDNTILLWDFIKKQPICIFKGHKDGVHSLAFSPNGRTLASGSYDHTVRLWDIIKKRFILKLLGHQYSVSSVAFSPDGTTLASGSYDKTVRLWDIASQKQIHIFEGHSKPVASVAFSPDGTQIASGSWDCTVGLWDIASKQLLHAFQDRYPWCNPFFSVAFSPDSRTLAAGSGSGYIQVFNIATKEPMHIFHHQNYNSWVGPDGEVWTDQLTVGAPEVIRSIAFSPDGTVLAGGTMSGTIRLWDLDTKPSSNIETKSMHIFKGHKDQVWSVAFAPDGRTVASGSGDGTVRLWHAKKKAE